MIHGKRERFLFTLLVGIQMLRSMKVEVFEVMEVQIL